MNEMISDSLDADDTDDTDLKAALFGLKAQLNSAQGNALGTQIPQGLRPVRATE